MGQADGPMAHDQIEVGPGAQPTQQGVPHRSPHQGRPRGQSLTRQRPVFRGQRPPQQGFQLAGSSLFNRSSRGRHNGGLARFGRNVHLRELPLGRPLSGLPRG